MIGGDGVDHELATLWVSEQFPEREPTGDKLTLYLDGNRDSLLILSFDKEDRVTWWAGKAGSDSGGLRGDLNVEKPDIGTLQMLERFLVSGRRRVLRRWEET
jgi:hypothetical protein